MGQIPTSDAWGRVSFAAVPIFKKPGSKCGYTSKYRPASINRPTIAPQRASRYFGRFLASTSL
jgi:hypothetical protein